MQFSQKIWLVAFLLSFTIASVTTAAFLYLVGLFSILTEVVTIVVPFIVFYRLGKDLSFFALSRASIVFLLLSTVGGYFAGLLIGLAVAGFGFQYSLFTVLGSLFMPSYLVVGIPLFFPYLFIFFVQFSALELAARRRSVEST